MGQKVHPTGIRLGIVKDWSSKWYADSKTFPEYIRQDHLVREFIKKKAEGRVCKPNSDRAAGEESQHHDSYGTSGNRHWQEGRGHRKAARGSGDR